MPGTHGYSGADGRAEGDGSDDPDQRQYRHDRGNRDGRRGAREEAESGLLDDAREAETPPYERRSTPRPMRC